MNYPVAGFATATGAFVNDWFDTTDQATIVPGWDGTPSGGIAKFAVSKVELTPGSVSPVSGGGTVAKVVLTASAAGVYDITLSDVVLSDRNANPIATVVSPNKVTVEVCGFATIKGKVMLQGRATAPAGTNPPTNGTVSLADAGYGPFSGKFDSTGTFTILNVKVAPAPGGTSYTINAAHGLYLGNRMTMLAPLMPGATYTRPDTTLKGGDADNSGKIASTDLGCIGSDFGGLPAVCGDRQQRHQCGWHDEHPGSGAARRQLFPVHAAAMGSVTVLLSALACLRLCQRRNVFLYESMVGAPA